MALSNTLYAGLSGLDVAQAKLNVVGNNIANANTVAFKGTRALIKSQFYVTDSGGSQPEGDNGGSNPLQRGLGAVISELERNFQPGTIESTGRPTDLAIDGDGFFIVESDERKYTRDGTFKLNPHNDLVTSSGDYLMGYAADASFNLNAAQLSRIHIPLNVATTAQATSIVKMQGNLNAGGTAASGASVIGTQDLTTLGGAAAPTDTTLLAQVASASDPAAALFAVGDVLTLDARKGAGATSRDLGAETFTVDANSTLGDLMSFLQGSLEISTGIPDDGNAQTPDPGVGLVPGAANSVRLQIVGNSGAANALSLEDIDFKTAGGIAPLLFADTSTPDGIESNPAGESIHTSFTAYDSLGTAVNVSVTAVLESSSDIGTVWRFYTNSADSTNGDRVTGSGLLTFDNDGRFVDATNTTVAIDRGGTGATTPLRFNLDFREMTALTHKNPDFAMAAQDGLAIGRLANFSIGTDGKITGSFSNGATRTLGQIAMATFANRQGLVDRGGNTFVEGPNSGPAVVGTPGTLGSGAIVSGSLELSNVDISEEFINLIIASTGFQAASRVITTSDQLLMALLNSR